MAAMTNYLENKLVDHIFRATPYTVPTTLHVALFSAAPTDSAAGTEISGGSYARASVPASAIANWNGTHGSTSGASTGTNATCSNAALITFPSPTAIWGSVVGFAIMDAATGGNALFYGDLTIPKTVNNGDAAPTFAAGALTVQLDN